MSVAGARLALMSSSMLSLLRTEVVRVATRKAEAQGPVTIAARVTEL